MLQDYTEQLKELSGLEVNSEVHFMVEQYIDQKLKSLASTLQRMRSAIDKSIINYLYR